ncbi:DUF6794 domain-containing protein [Desulfurivibrio sp. C05AmB]|uniref:DUF6794 domain-containing protein n=1 Tax=Desulfurivibrio sp. C05AmB TaxID=3374371 RepID=UPI00376F24C1
MKQPSEWPETVEQAVNKLLDLLHKDETDKIAAMPMAELFLLHFGLGQWIRNEFGLWSENTALLESTGRFHPDDAANVIIEALWRRLQD